MRFLSNILICLMISVHVGVQQATAVWWSWRLCRLFGFGLLFTCQIVAHKVPWGCQGLLGSVGALQDPLGFLGSVGAVRVRWSLLWMSGSVRAVKV